MSDITRILSRIEQGDKASVDELLPLVYEELRKLAASKLATELPGQTLQPTALVHEAYLRLIGDPSSKWESRGHFFAAAALAMRRIMVESARRKKRTKHGGDMVRHELYDATLAAAEPIVDILDLDEALDNLAKQDPDAANLVQLRYFIGLSVQESAEAMGMPLRSAERLWAYAKAWLHQALVDPANTNET